MTNPKVTVLMPVYNAERYVGKAIESILKQTFKDFEFLIINDNSTDNSLSIINSYHDPRITLFSNKNNCGLSYTLNRGIEIAKGEYIARMDADDISLPKRLEKQIKFMENHPEIGICGAWIHSFDKLGDCNIWHYPSTHEELVSWLFFNCCFAHPTVVIRKKLFWETGLKYNQEFKSSEDYDLWVKLMKITKGGNLQEVLLKYRLSDNQMSSSKSLQILNANKVRFQILNSMGFQLDQAQQEFHSKILNDSWCLDMVFFEKAIHWLETISETNKSQKVFPEPWFTVGLSKFLFGKLLMYGSLSLDTYSLYKASRLSLLYKPSFYDLLKLRIKTLVKFWR